MRMVLVSIELEASRNITKHRVPFSTSSPPPSGAKRWPDIRQTPGVLSGVAPVSRLPWSRGACLIGL